MEIEDIIQEIIDEEDQEIKQEQINKEHEEAKKTRRAKILKINQIFLAIVIMIFLLMILLPWFKLGGRATSEGLVRIPKSIISKEYKALDINSKLEYNGVYVKMSPVNLISYVTKYFNEYKIIIDDKGNEKISLFSYLHMIYIYLFIVAAFISIVSIIILLLEKGLKYLWVIKWSVIINLIIFTLNYLALKISFFNMYTLYALSQLKKINADSFIDMTQKGIAVGNEFYQYTLSLTIPFFITLVLLIIWLVMVLVLNRIKKSEK